MSEQIPGLITSEAAANHLGVPYRVLMRLVEAGLVEPYVAGQRKRAPRLWAPAHLEHAKLAHALISAGVRTEAAVVAMSVFRANRGEARFLVLGDGDAWVWNGKSNLSAVFSSGPAFRVVNIQKLLL